MKNGSYFWDTLYINQILHAHASERMWRGVQAECHMHDEIRILR